MRKVKYAFTMIELIFVIVIMGILSKFGVEFLAQAYQSFIFSKVNNTLQAQSEVAVETIASRLQFRIKDSIIARKDTTHFEALGNISDDAYKTLEWVGMDIDGLRGDSNANWSGIIDLDASFLADNSGKILVSPATDVNKTDSLIAILSKFGGNGASGIDNAAIYFIGSDSNIKTGYGWASAGGGVDAFTDQNNTMHPIKKIAANQFAPRNANNGTTGDFIGQDIYEYYQLAWTAYAVSFEDGPDADTKPDRLMLYYDYQPWDGENYQTDASSVLLMENVSTFRFTAVGSVVKIQVCVKSTVIDGSNDDGEGYSLCKEKTIF